MKKLICTLLAAAMLITAVPVTAFADEPENPVVSTVSSTPTAINELADPSDDEGSALPSYEGLVKVDGVWGYYENGVLTGLNALAKNDWGWWYIDETGHIDMTYNGVAANEWGTWCVIDGKVKTNVNGLTKVGNTWYYFVNGKLTGTENLQPNKYGWWYIGSDGKIDFSYNGVASNEWGTWCVINGTADTSANGITELSATKYYFVDGKLTGVNGIIEEGGVSWMVSSDGVVDETYNGLFTDAAGASWNITSGYVDKETNGLTTVANTAGVTTGGSDAAALVTCYFNEGKVDSTYDGLSKVNGVWYYFKSGIILGLNALAKNNWGWWYIGSEGRIDSTYNGIADNEWGTWRVIDGKVTTAVNGLTKVGNTWYYFVNGKLTGTNSLQPNKYGWWYIGSDGKIDTAYNGVASNEWGTWCVINGKVTQSVSGLTKVGNTWYYFVSGKLTGLNSIANNKWGWWYIGSDGKIDKAYNGIASNEWGTWCVINGKVNESANGLVKLGDSTYYFNNGKLATEMNGLTKVGNTWYNFKNGKVIPHTVCIDAGHQSSANTNTEPVGPGSATRKTCVAGGTRGISTGIPEYQLTLAVAKLLAEDLRASGINVVMIRETNDVNITNAERAQIANNSGADIYIRIHADGSASSSVRGAHTSCMTSSNPWNANLYNDSYRLCTDVINSYCSSTGFANRGVRTRDDLTGTNWSQIPVCLIELGFMSNPTEDAQMNSAAMQSRMAQSICNGILAYYAEN